MTALPDLPLPPELAVDVPPLTDDDLDRLTEASEAGIQDLESLLRSPHVPESVRAWRIEDDGQAEWAARKLAIAQADYRSVVERMEEWTARILHWFRRSAGPLNHTIVYFEGQLMDYALRCRAADEKHTRVMVPSGTVTTRKAPPAVEVADEAAVVAWLKADPDRAEALKVTEAVLVSEIRKLVTITDGGDVVDSAGERVPGVAVRPGGVTAKVTTGG